MHYFSLFLVFFRGEPPFSRLKSPLFPSEKHSMSRFQSFAEHLERQIRKQIEAEISEESPLGTGVEPQCLDQLLGQLGPIRFKPTPKLTHKPGLYNLRPKKIIRPPHKLTPIQKNALAFFQAHGADLADNFNLKELKQAFRKLASQLHPDRSKGPAEPFIELKKAFDYLRQVFAC